MVSNMITFHHPASAGRKQGQQVHRSNEPDAFLAFEREGWNTVICGYERLFGPLTAQTVAPMLDAAGVASGCQVLDVCTGHGVLAAAASNRGARVSALDFAEEVVAAARHNVPTVEFQQGDAQNLPYPSDAFDAVICGYGIMHVPEPARALAEMYRVTRSGGRVALSVWERPAQNNGLGLLFGAIETHGRLDVSLPHGPDSFQFGDSDNMRAALTQVGFKDVEAITVAQAWQFEHATDLIDHSTGHCTRKGAY
jgi:ubiquinone/menaquinone biosynthesis C-methylase UbiE